MITEFKMFEIVDDTIVKLNIRVFCFGLFLYRFIKKNFNVESLTYEIAIFNQIHNKCEYFKINLGFGGNTIRLDYLSDNKVRYVSTPNLSGDENLKINKFLIDVAKNYTDDILINHFVINIDDINDIERDIPYYFDLYTNTNKYNL